MFYVYVLKNTISGKPYYGYTADLKRRVREHGRYWKLVYYEAYTSKADALLRERKLKDYGQARSWLKLRIAHSYRGV